MSNDKKKYTLRINPQAIKAIESVQKKFADDVKKIQSTVEQMAKPMYDLAAKIQKVIDREKEKFAERYKVFYPAMRRMLLERNCHVPESSDEMFKVWLFEILDYKDVDDMNRVLEREDFIKFHEIMEKKISEELSMMEDNGSNTIEALIQEFAEEFSKNAKYTSDRIYTYVTHWEQVKSLSNPRSRAKKFSKCSDIADGTLKNWEVKWTSFYNSRTTK